MPASAKRPTVQVALVGGPMYDPLYASIPAFTARTGIDVEIVARLPHPELNAFVENAFASRRPLDLISTHTKYAPAQAEWLSPLDEVADPGLVADLLPRPAALARIDGAMLQIPRNLDIRLLHFRTDVVAHAPETWDALIETALAVTARGNVTPFFGFLFPGRDSGLFGCFYELLISAGGELFDEDLRPAFDSAAGHWALTQIVDMHHRHRITPRELPAWHYDDISACFREGHAAMLSDWPGSYHLYRDPQTCRVAAHVGLALLPAGPAGLRAAYAGCHSFAIPRRARTPDAAARLLAHFTSFESQLGEARRGAIPCRTSALAAVRAEAAGEPPEARRWQLLADTEPTMIIPPRFAAYPQCEDVLWRRVQQAMMGELSAADALRQAAADVHTIVSDRSGAEARAHNSVLAPHSGGRL
jgi:multiple sugar transport system substrate-binding protein